MKTTAGRRRWMFTAAGAVAVVATLSACGPKRDASDSRAKVVTPSGGAAGNAASTALAVPTTAVSVSVGMTHACVVLSDGRIWCWGGNQGSQLGAIPDSESSSVAVPIEAKGSFTTVAAGGAHSCALASDGAAWCWGSNSQGQTGDGSARTLVPPTAVAGNRRFTALSVGMSHSCGLDTDGVAWCWGANQLGQLGNGGTAVTHVPTRVVGDARYRAIAAGGAATCAIAMDSAVWCWGASPVGHGAVGAPLHTSQPVAVPALDGIESLSLAPSLACAVTAAHGVVCAGDNSSGQLGNGSADEMLSQHLDPNPVNFPGGVTITRVSAGEGHACAIAGDGHAWCWGRGESGEVGDSPTLSRCTAGTGTVACAKQPVAVAADRTFRTIAVGADQSCGITREGRLVCWGGSDRAGVREIAIGGR